MWDSLWVTRHNKTWCLIVHHLSVSEESWVYEAKAKTGCTAKGWLPQITVCIWHLHLQSRSAHLFDETGTEQCATIQTQRKSLGEWKAASKGKDSFCNCLHVCEWKTVTSSINSEVFYNFVKKASGLPHLMPFGGKNPQCHNGGR